MITRITPSFRRSTALALVSLFAGGLLSTALAQGDSLVTLCYRNRTIKVPSYLVTRYLAQPGTVAGPCQVTPQ